MKRTALILVLMAACGGKKPEPAKPDTTSTEQASTTEQAPPATPAEPAAPAEPPKPAAPDPAVVAAAALAEQYELGKKVYTEKGCVKCHGEKGEGSKTSPVLIGEKALPEKAAAKAKARKKVVFKTAADVATFVKTKMPPKKENTLTDEEAHAVTAWILSENKAKIDAKLDATNAASVNVREAAAAPAAAPK